MSETLERLRDANFQLELAMNNLHDHQSVRACLNAFLDLARSTTWIMQKEFAHKSGFQEWYKKKQDEMRENSLFGFFVEMRNISVKERSLGNEVRITTRFDKPLVVKGGTETIIPLGKVDGRGNLVLDNESSITTDSKPIETRQITNKSYFFNERPNDDALELCREYVNLLKNLVIECENKFSQ